MASGEASELKEFKICVLKVPIHCEGCKKKVKKVISKIPGVHDIAIDSKLNKVTVSGSVDADTILAKLIKSNKHVELWPDDNNKKKQPAAPKSAGENSDTKPSAALSKEMSASEKPEPKETPKPPEPAAKQPAEPEVVTVSEPAGAEPKNETENQSEKPNSSPAPAAAAPKKKSKRPHKVPAPAPAPAAEEAATPPADTAESSGRARGTGRPMPEHPTYINHPQPVHAYNMVHPTTSYSHYAPVPAPVPAQAIPSYGDHYGYTYNHTPELYANHYASRQAPPEHYYNNQDSYYSPYSAYPPPEASEPAAPAENYDLFSDENANSCNVM